MEKASTTRASATRQCKYKACGADFTPKRVTQVFCSPSCKTRHTMDAYEKGLKVIESKGIHHRTMDNPILRKVYKLLSDGKPHTIKEIRLATGNESGSTLISELRRASGKEVKCTFAGRTESGAKIFEYRLTAT